MAGEMGKSTLSSNADDILDTSFHYAASNGVELGLPSKYGILLVFNSKGWYNTLQLYFGILSAKVHYRVHQTEWGDWIQIN